MAFPRSLSAILSATILLFLISDAAALCHKLSSSAAYCSQHSGEALDVVKAASTAPLPVKALGTALPTHKTVEEKHQAVALKAAAPPAEPPLQNGTGSSTPEDIKSLPTPTGTLVVTAFGTGTQNYSCPDPASPSATPTLVGAVADLFNANDASRPLIGHHYFNAAGNPTFDFSSGSMFNVGVLQTQKTKAGDITSPVAKAVDWLNLVSDGLGEGNLQEVYRVNTAGGKPAPGQCGGKTAGSIIRVPYHAYYYFYS